MSSGAMLVSVFSDRVLSVFEWVIWDQRARDKT